MHYQPQRPPTTLTATSTESERIASALLAIRQRLFHADIFGDRTTFPEDIEGVAREIVAALDETVVELWLVEMQPWGQDREDQAMRCYASISAVPSLGAPRMHQSYDDIVLAVMTAGRPLRFDDAADHPLVHAWLAGLGLLQMPVQTFLGLPLFYHQELLGVLAVAIPFVPSVDHVQFLDLCADLVGVHASQARVLHALNAQRELAQTVLREAPIAAAVLKPDDFTITLTNPHFDNLLQIGPDVWGQRLDAVLPEHAMQLRQSLHLDDVVRSGQPRVLLDLPILLTTGKTYWDVTCSPIHAPDGSIEGILIAFVDVTSRVNQRQTQNQAIEIAQGRLFQMVALHQTSLAVSSQLGQDPYDLLRQIVEQMARLLGARGGMVYLVDRETDDLEVVVSSGFSHDYTGIRLRKGEGLAGLVAITGDGQWVDEYRLFISRASAFADAPFGAVAAVPMKQRGRVIGVICLVHEPAPADQPGESALTFNSDDIWLLDLFAAQAAHAIENARMYRELERTYEQERNRDRQKDDFIARISHDLRTPLTSVIGFVELALALLDVQPDQVRDLLQHASRDAGHLGEMMDQLLAQAQLDSGNREIHLKPLRLSSVVDEVVHARSRLAQLQGTGHRFVTDVPEEFIVKADLARLKEVLENLISNAMKYSPEGGAITVDASIDPSRSIQHVVVRVTDEGIGISPEEGERIFDRFVRAASPLIREIRGTGVGLYLARQLIESMGGTIWLERSEPGKGSTFAWSLPLYGVEALP